VGYDLGAAHGTPGIIALLAGACVAGPGGEPARSLLDDAVSWLLAQRRPPAEGCLFPHAVPADEAPEPTGLAWCYGDLGIAAVLMAAGRALGVPAWEDEALALARGAAARAAEPVPEPGLCHGAAGVAHLFNRLYQASGEPLLRAASLLWFERLLDRWQPEAREPGLLTGAAGIGLALLAASTPIEPVWDRVLGLSLRRPM
jgi:hypothetical protein